MTTTLEQLGHSRQGHTLVELVAAMACGVILLAGLGSVMLITRQIAYAPVASTSQIEAARAVNELADELRFATMITQYLDDDAEQLLEFVVADRDGDGRAERIRYDWPLHPDPAERVVGAPPLLFKRVTNSGGSTTWSVVETPSATGSGGPAFRVQLTEATPAATIARFTHALVQLQTSTTDFARVDSAVPLLARPERLSVFWRTDFDPGTNPTAIDADGNGLLDWMAGSGATFTGAVLSNGSWTANGTLSTNPVNNFATTTIVEARFKNHLGATNIEVPILQINADRQTSQGGGSYVPLLFRMRKRADGSQTLSLLVKPASGAEPPPLKVVDNLADDYVRVQLIVYPNSDRVSLRVNDAGDAALGGPFAYAPITPLPSDRCVKLFAGPRFDYVEVRVGAN